MPRTRKRTRVEREAMEPMEEMPPEPVAKKRKLTAEEYTEKCARQVKKRGGNKPLQISQYYFVKAVKKLRKHDYKNKGKHPLIQQRGRSGERALMSCTSCSLDTLNRSLVPTVNYTPTWHLLVKELRKGLLARNWSYCLRLFDAYLKHGSLRRQNLIFLIRSTCLLMLNLNVSNERLREFLTVTLSIRDPEMQDAFLVSLTELKQFSRVSPKTARNNESSSKKDGSEEEDDPDDIVFSSGDDPDHITSSDEDDSDDIVPSEKGNNADDIVPSEKGNDSDNIDRSKEAVSTDGGVSASSDFSDSA